MKKLLLSGLAAALTFGARAQTPTDLTQFNQQRQRLERGAVIGLGSWTLGNLAVSGVAIGQTEGVTREFHRMNVYWNLVNLAFVGAGAAQWAKSEDPAAITVRETFKKQRRFEKTLLFNAGLDVGYVATGFYLRERAGNVERNADQWEGFGRSLILQGGFLLVFDAVMYVLFQRHGRKLDGLLQQFAPDRSGSGVQWRF
ncbi:MAG: hypothetical protein WBA12_01460 [Catalinimonas sp.]